MSFSMPTNETVIIMLQFAIKWQNQYNSTHSVMYRVIRDADINLAGTLHSSKVLWEIATDSTDERLHLFQPALLDSGSISAMLIQRHGVTGHVRLQLINSAPTCLIVGDHLQATMKPVSPWPQSIMHPQRRKANTTMPSVSAKSPPPLPSRWTPIS